VLFRSTMQVKITNKSKHPLPQYESLGASGMDVRANLEEAVSIEPLGRALIKTGLFLEMEIGLECQVRPRSGLVLKRGITFLITPGTVGAYYCGEIGVFLVNLSNETVLIEDGERVAQLVFCKVEQVQLTEVEQLNESTRGAGGFGSTGVK